MRCWFRRFTLPSHFWTVDGDLLVCEFSVMSRSSLTLHPSVHLHQEPHACKCNQFPPSFHPFSRSWGRRAIHFYVPSILALLGLCCVCWQVLIILWHSHQSWTEITSLLIIQLVAAGSQLLPICVPRGSIWGLLRGALGELSPARIQLANAQCAVLITCPLLAPDRGGFS